MPLLIEIKKRLGHYCFQSFNSRPSFIVVVQPAEWLLLLQLTIQ